MIPSTPNIFRINPGTLEVEMKRRVARRRGTRDDESLRIFNGYVSSRALKN
jgi:hypothetical protein